MSVSLEKRSHILHVLTRHLQMAADVDLSTLSETCVNFTGADLKAVLYNAQLEAIRETMDVAAPGMLGRVIKSADILEEDNGVSRDGISTGQLA